MTTFEKAVVRTLIHALNDGYGLNETAYHAAADVLTSVGRADILEAVDATEGRFYLHEAQAEEFLSAADLQETE